MVDNVGYIALSRQIALQKELDITANNLANLNTTGFKFEQLLIAAQKGDGAINVPIKAQANFAYDHGVGRDFSQGSFVKTENVFDIALDGEGTFFTLEGPDGPLYTRNGAFTVNEAGVLTNQDGYPVQGVGGAALTIDPLRGAPVISKNGIVSQTANGTSEIVGRIGVVRVNNLSQLEKMGDTNYRLGDDADAPQAANDARMIQGMFEGSNVNAMVEMTKLVEINRAYSRIASIIDQNQQLSKTAISQLGRVA